jgi:hypothetical protein
LLFNGDAKNKAPAHGAFLQLFCLRQVDCSSTPAATATTPLRKPEDIEEPARARCEPFRLVSKVRFLQIREARNLYWLKLLNRLRYHRLSHMREVAIGGRSPPIPHVEVYGLRKVTP